jgi:hypothetical protein
MNDAVELARAGGRLGSLMVKHGENAEQVAVVKEARRNHVALRIKAKTDDLMTGVLPLTEQQIADIVALLKGE